MPNTKSAIQALTVNSGDYGNKLQKL